MVLKKAESLGKCNFSLPESHSAIAHSTNLREALEIFDKQFNIVLPSQNMASNESISRFIASSSFFESRFASIDSSTIDGF
jgi:hypothetical protein